MHDVHEAKPLEKTVEEHASELGTEKAFFAAAKAMNQWPELKRMTEAEYTAAIDAAKSVEIH